MNQKTNFSTCRRGFTMIELLVVATIIIVLTMIGMVSYSRAAISGRNAKRKADMEIVRQALVLYKADNGVYPDSPSVADLVDGELDDYISEDTIQDPKDGSYTYSLESGNMVFTLCASLEPDSEDYCVGSP